MKISVVIPTYNEKDNLSELLPKIFDVFKRHNLDGDVVVVDDSSPDKTADEVRRLKSLYPIKLIERQKKMGLGSAYIVGFKEALESGSEIIFEMDADLSHDPTKIPTFIEKLNEGCDVVIGSRLVEGGSVVGWGWHRKLVSFGGNLIGRTIAGIDTSDLTSGYRSYRSNVLNSIDFDKVKSKSYDFQIEMLARSIRKGFIVRSIPITFHDRTRGKSKLSKADIIKFLVTAVKIRANII